MTRGSLLGDNIVLASSLFPTPHRCDFFSCLSPCVRGETTERRHEKKSFFGWGTNIVFLHSPHPQGPAQRPQQYSTSRQRESTLQSHRQVYAAEEKKKNGQARTKVILWSKKKVQHPVNTTGHMVHSAVRQILRIHCSLIYLVYDVICFILQQYSQQYACTRSCYTPPLLP